MAAQRPSIAAYPWTTSLTTRWSDNDVYGHVNNVIYYSLFDSAANLFLMRRNCRIWGNPPTLHRPRKSGRNCMARESEAAPPFRLDLMVRH